MARVAIIGAGAVGLVLADAALQAGHAVTLCGRHAPRRIVLVDGRRSEPTTRMSEAAVCRDPREAEPSDLVVLAVKRQDSIALGEWDALRGEETVLLLTQNGLVGAGAQGAVPAVVGFGAERVSRGVALHTSGDLLTVPAATGFSASWFDEAAVRIVVTAEFASAQWRKAAVNLCAGGLTTVFGEGFGIFRDPFVGAIAHALLDEVRAVASADGVELGEELADEVLADLRSRPADGTTSLLRDSRAGAPLELDAHGGDILRIAARYGVPAPLSAQLIDALDTQSSARYRELIR